MTQMAHDPRVTERRAFVRARAWVLAMMGGYAVYWLAQLF